MLTSLGHKQSIRSVVVLVGQTTRIFQILSLYLGVSVHTSIRIDGRKQSENAETFEKRRHSGWVGVRNSSCALSALFRCVLFSLSVRNSKMKMYGQADFSLSVALRRDSCESTTKTTR